MGRFEEPNMGLPILGSQYLVRNGIKTNFAREMKRLEGSG